MGWEREIGGKPGGPGLIPVRDDGWIFIKGTGCSAPCSLCSWKLGPDLLLVGYGAAWVRDGGAKQLVELASCQPFSPKLLWGAVPCYLHWC